MSLLHATIYASLGEYAFISLGKELSGIPASRKMDFARKHGMVLQSGFTVSHS